MSTLIVMLAEWADVPYEDGVEERLAKRGLLPWSSFEDRFGQLSLKRLFTALEPDEIRALIREGEENDADYRGGRLLSCYQLESEPEAAALELSEDLRRYDVIDKVYLHIPSVEPSTILPCDDPEFENQGHLQPAPSGIDAVFAWKHPGGCGEGQALVDVERGWTLDHEDLPKGISELHGAIRASSRSHGTNVLGVICSVDNNKKGGVGITPKLATIGVASHHQSNLPDALLAAANYLGPGGVLLVEAHLKDSRLPVEVLDCEFEVIRLATALGRTVVAAAGNGSKDLDEIPILNPGAPEFRDSKAILVGASSSGHVHVPIPTSNRGARVGSFAWGEDVTTASSDSSGDRTGYTWSFKETSSAAAIVAGAALAVQGLAEAHSGKTLDPVTLRSILSDPSTGTCSKNPAQDKIGVMPNLRAILERHFS